MDPKEINEQLKMITFCAARSREVAELAAELAKKADDLSQTAKERFEQASEALRTMDKARFVRLEAEGAGLLCDAVDCLLRSSQLARQSREQCQTSVALLGRITSV